MGAKSYEELKEEVKELKAKLEVAETVEKKPAGIDPQKDIVVVYGRGEVGMVGFTSRKTIWAIPQGGHERVPMQDDTKRIELPFSLKKGNEHPGQHPYTAILDFNIATAMGVTVGEARDVIENHEEFKTGKIKILYEGKDRAEATSIAWTSQPVKEVDIVAGGRGSGSV